MAAQAPGVFVRFDPEAHQERVASDLATGPLQVGFDGCMIGELAPGQPGHRHGIDEAGGALVDCPDPFVRRVRGDQIDHGQPRLAGSFVQRRAFLRRQIGQDQSVHARLHRIVAEGPVAVAIDRVDVAHEQQRCLTPGPEPFGRAKCVGQTHAVAERPLAGPLDRHAFGQRIAEGHAQLDEIRAGLVDDLQQGAGTFRIRKPVRQKQAHGLLTTGPQRCEHRLQAIDHVSWILQGHAASHRSSAEGHGAPCPYTFIQIGTSGFAFGWVSTPVWFRLHIPRNGVHVFVATAGQVDHHDGVRSQLAGQAGQKREGVRRFQCRNNPLGAGQQPHAF